MKPKWRLITHGAVDGALNMALDRAIQLCHERGASPPTVRLYGWARPTVTLGRFQQIGSVDLQACDDLRIDVVRRFTGGRGVIHDDELTYCIVAGTDDGVPRGVAASYTHLCAALVETYALLGIGADLTEGRSGERSASACYLQTTRADLSHRGAKLAGSAQVWAGSTVMQHGSFTVSRDTEREQRVFRLTDEQREHLGTGTVTLSEVLSCAVDRSSIASAAITGFERGLGIDLVPGELTALEASLVDQLMPNVRVRVNREGSLLR